MKPDPNIFIRAAEVFEQDDLDYACVAISDVQEKSFDEVHDTIAHHFFAKWFKPKKLPYNHKHFGWWGSPYYPHSMCVDRRVREARILALLLCVEVLKTES